MALIILVSLVILVCLFQTWFIFYQNKKIMGLLGKKKEDIIEIKDTDIIKDVVEYTINSGLECMIMPNQENKTTLFVRGKEDQIIPISNIPIVTKNDYKEYSSVLKTITEGIDSFIKENKDLVNVKN